MAASNHKSYSEFGSVMRAGLTALCLTTALCTPALAAGKGGISLSIGHAVGGSVGSIGGAVGGAVGGVGGAVGGIGGSVGSISSGSGGGVSIGGVNIGNTGGVGGSSPHFTGSNFFSGGVDFGNGAAHGVSRGTQFTGQRLNKGLNRDSAITAKILKNKSD